MTDICTATTEEDGTLEALATYIGETPRSNYDYNHNAFLEYDRANPGVREGLIKALGWIESLNPPPKRVSVGLLIEILRSWPQLRAWKLGEEKSEFKIDAKFCPFYARALINDDPTLEKKFKTKAQPSKLLYTAWVGELKEENAGDEEFFELADANERSTRGRKSREETPKESA